MRLQAFSPYVVSNGHPARHVTAQVFPYLGGALLRRCDGSRRVLQRRMSLKECRDLGFLLDRRGRIPRRFLIMLCSGSYVATQNLLSTWRRRRRCGWNRLVLPSEQWGDSANRDATILPFRSVSWNLQVLLSITLRSEVLGRNLELL